MYCGNNPIKNADTSGNLFGAIIGGIVGGILGGLTAAASGKSVKAGIITGAVTGAMIGGICDGSAALVATAAGTVAKCAVVVKTMVACSSIAATGNLVNQAANYHKEKKSMSRRQRIVHNHMLNSKILASQVQNRKDTKAFGSMLIRILLLRRQYRQQHVHR